MAEEILIALGLRRRRRPELVVCPTCGRAEIDVVKLARQVEKVLHKIDKPYRIAVMGCIVNGPGEAADADFAICAAKDKAYFYHHGRKTATVPEQEIIPRLLEALAEL
jgi:(E)-4-hydroxy-3-methylbut-2-enyl-diphosphate synthase